MKRKDTIALENALKYSTRLKRIYGCEEITIGFYYNGKGNEIVDFMTMDSKGIIKCYELKVTLEDLKSSAKKSWYGHYNYLVTTPELYAKIDDWDKYIPNSIGIIVGTNLTSYRKAKKNNISEETSTMLKESMVRSLFWKMEKYKDTQSINKHKSMQSEINQLKKERDRYRDEAQKSYRLIDDYERYMDYNHNVDINLQEVVKKEREIFQKNREAERKRKGRR